jgi:hypothetical protein
VIGIKRFVHASEGASRPFPVIQPGIRMRPITLLLFY